MIEPGYYDARLVDYGLTKSKAGLPMAFLKFEFTDDHGGLQSLSYFGSFKEGKAAEITCEALAVCGWTTNNPADLAKGIESGVLKKGAVVSITVEMNTWEGKTSPRIKYINPIGSGGVKNILNPQDAAQAFGGMDLRAVAQAAKNKYKNVQPPKLDEDEGLNF
jgi:hypothetical protein